MSFRSRACIAVVVVALTGALSGALASCTGCEPKPIVDAGPDSGVDTDAGQNVDAGTAVDGGTFNPDGGPRCNEHTPGFGTACSSAGTDPKCGLFQCNPLTDSLACNDPGPNKCNVCGTLDQTAGRVGEACGEFGCGLAVCNAAGDATQCLQDHARNVCGGCTILDDTVHPGDVCSVCATGTQQCTRDQNELVCARGRAPDNQCGGCGRCILAHAFMDDRFQGGYVRNGTLALIEDVGGGVVQLVFEPLVEGPGAAGLPNANVYLSNGDNPLVTTSTALSPAFAASIQKLGTEPLRTYTLPPGLPLASFDRVVIFESTLLDATISVGALELGPPPGFVDPGLPDAGVRDAGVVDGGTHGASDAGVRDAGVGDAGVRSTNDAGVLDAGTVDAG